MMIRILKAFLRALSLSVRMIGLLLFTPIALCALLLLVLVAVNCLDERLDAETEAWLKNPVASVPDAQNGYFALMSLDAQVDQPLAAAVAAVQNYRAIHGQAESADKTFAEQYQSATRDILKPLDLNLKELNRCEGDCYRTLKEDGKKRLQLSKEYATPLERYKAMLDMPAYSEEVVFDHNAPVLRYVFPLRLGLL
jgi:hypothetical protein